jgi:hypothetical protein
VLVRVASFNLDGLFPGDRSSRGPVAALGPKGADVARQMGSGWGPSPSPLADGFGVSIAVGVSER